ncbi:MAG: VOC family protein [Planctomycetes bacterium]|nr:VOC family protein [Planctomycetota bacterium]
MNDFSIHHVNVNVDDLDAAIVFYRDVIGLPLDVTPDQGFRSQFFRIGRDQQIHMNEIADVHQFRGHFCLVAPDFVGVFRRAKAADAIDLKPWGRVRRLPSGAMQMFVRDPAGNLVEIGSARDADIDVALFEDELVEPEPGIYRMAPGASVGAHETP